MLSSATQKYSIPVIKKDQPDDNHKFQNLPEPTGPYPYRLSLENANIFPAADKMVFHMVGDTGSLRSPDFQKLVAGQMEEQFSGVAERDQPAFLYHLGDVVYNHGEVERYQRQFFEPYQNYPRPIFAIPGNHDSDVNPDNPVSYRSLDAFTKVFCTPNAGSIAFSGGNRRQSMTQPNVYWTLETPLVNFIGLHGNVTKFGSITAEQKEWFINELKWAGKQRPEKALIVCIHHAPFSADINHGASIPMIEFFESAYKETGVKPDIVFSGHVHNYQRFAKKYDDGTVVPFIVAGAGGYDELHPVALLSDDRFTPDSPLFEGVTLENFCDTKHGFLKVSVEKKTEGVEIAVEYYTIPHEKIMETFDPAPLADAYRFIVK
ncbi:metallophosphoesterase [Dyadobacter sp. CY312]|uniref:metallophosphoesterase family protein n=1 Tax=Dyadobacter sp. CY312 TaxID=2907303 RepID=UPI001F35AF0F|nr:metallophosphoesterase [Dyadobacter sp. CY312]MCE7043231.1 metallophosphoesterase [Dyadobacter sp. CY312]